MNNKNYTTELKNLFNNIDNIKSNVDIFSSLIEEKIESKKV